MNTRQLQRVMESDPYGKRQFQGVFAADRIPTRIESYHSAFIANTDPASKPGAHWVAFYFPSDNRGEFFDSYGHPPAFYHRSFENVLKNNGRSWTYNRECLQGMSSQVCGQYCLYYLLNRCRSVHIAKIFSRYGAKTGMIRRLQDLSVNAIIDF